MKKCLICNKKIIVKNSHSGKTERRSKRAVTCSRKCSKIYRKITLDYCLAGIPVVYSRPIVRAIARKTNASHVLPVLS